MQKTRRFRPVAIGLLSAGLLMTACDPPTSSSSLTASCPQAASASTSAVPAVKRVFVVVMENTNADEAKKQPFFRELLSTGAYLSNYHGVARPSQPNYIAMTAGSTLGVDSNKNYDLEGRHLGDLLEEKGKDWRLYAEDYPGNCFLEASSGAYARKHVPFLSYRNVTEDPQRCAKIVSSNQLEADIRDGKLPDFAMYIPNNSNNGHDTGVQWADQFLSRTFGPLLKNPDFADGTLFVVTFDESGGDESNRIYTLLHGESVQPGTTDGSCYTHYSLLRTVEEALQLGSLERQDRSATPIQGIWSGR